MPVRIRNMSRSGALVEGTAMPPAGTEVRLSRGSLCVAGEIMWAELRKAGLRFAAPAVAADWLPNGQRGVGQQLADELVHKARLGVLPISAVDQRPTIAAGLHEEILRLHQILQRAGEELASDEALAATHLMSLQAIDGVTSCLAKLVGK
jgi:hypothetical protein